MAIINVTPIMTSNTNPSPYVASASGQDTSYYAWKAFNGTFSSASDMWCAKFTSISKQYPQWIQLDFGEDNELIVNAFGITSRNSGSASSPTYAPKEFVFSGSLDGVNWTELGEYTETSWGAGEKKQYEVKNNKKYRYYRISIYSVINTKYSTVAISNISFYLDEDRVSEEETQNPNISHKNASLTYILPMATTKEIQAKTNDTREGLLGMANDSENYGDLYVVGKDGKSHLTKAGIKSKVIFDGVANSTGEYNLTDNIKKFKCVLVMAKIDHTNELLNDSTSDIVYNAEFEGMKYRCMSVYFSSESHYSIEYRLIDDKLEIYTTKKGTSSVWSNPHIYQIIGIY